MARLTFDSLNHSRTAGMFTVSGKGYLALGKAMAQQPGIEGVEVDESSNEYTLTYHKASFDQCGIRDLFKSLKKTINTGE